MVELMKKKPSKTTKKRGRPEKRLVITEAPEVALARLLKPTKKPSA